MTGSSFFASKVASKKALYLRVAVMPLALLSLSSCAGMIAGVGATIGTAAVQEGGLSRAAVMRVFRLILMSVGFHIMLICLLNLI